MQTRVKIKEIMKQLSTTFVERDKAIECIWLAVLTRQNFILVGDPGTAKTAVVNASYMHIEGARIFSTLCGSFATEDKIFGPTDIKAFQEGEYRKSTKGRLADCDFGFLDELLKSNEGTLNGMLTALNERTYEGKPIALRTCGAATNWPELRARSENVAALWDRILLRCEVKDLTKQDQRIKMLEAIDKVRDYQPAINISMAELDQAYAEIRAIDVSQQARLNMVKIQEALEKKKITSSARRYGALQQVLRALAWLDDRNTVLLDDFDALSLGLWTARDDIDAVRAVVDAVDHDVVNECLSSLRDAIQKCSGNPTATQIPNLLQTAANAATKARAQLTKSGARRKGRAEIKHELEQLKAIYDKLRGRVEPHGVKAAATDQDGSNA